MSMTKLARRALIVFGAGAALLVALGSPAGARTLTGVTLDRAEVTGGHDVQGSVTLAARVSDARGVVVRLSSSSRYLASVPDQVVVPYGFASASFAVNTHPVARDRSAVTISATAGSVTKAATLTIRTPVLEWLALAAKVVGGNDLGGTVWLSGPAPTGGWEVALSSDNPRVLPVPLAGEVTVPSGASHTRFNLKPAVVAQPRPVTITAHSGATISRTVTVLPPSLVSLGCSGSSSVEVTGGDTIYGCSAVLDGPAPAGFSLPIASTDDSIVHTLPYLTLPYEAGSDTRFFSVHTNPVTSDTGHLSVFVGEGSAWRSVSITVLAPRIESVQIAPASVTGGNSATLTVGLTGWAEDLAVSLHSDRAAAPVPATLVVDGDSETFEIETLQVSQETTARITASVNGSSLSALLNIKAVAAPTPIPDLVVQSMYFVPKESACTAAPVAYPGNENGYRACAKVKNQGTAAVQVTTRLHIDTYTHYPSDDFYGSIPKDVGPLAAGAVATVEVEHVNQLGFGVWKEYTPMADANGNVSESIEWNNTGTTLRTDPAS